MDSPITGRRTAPDTQQGYETEEQTRSILDPTQRPEKQGLEDKKQLRRAAGALRLQIQRHLAQKFIDFLYGDNATNPRYTRLEPQYPPRADTEPSSKHMQKLSETETSDIIEQLSEPYLRWYSLTAEEAGTEQNLEEAKRLAQLILQDLREPKFQRGDDRNRTFLYPNAADAACELEVQCLINRAHVAYKQKRFAKANDLGTEAWYCARKLDYEPIEARCCYWLALAKRGLEMRMLAAQDAFKALPCIGKYIEGKYMPGLVESLKLEMVELLVGKKYPSDEEYRYWSDWLSRRVRGDEAADTSGDADFVELVERGHVQAIHTVVPTSGGRTDMIGASDRKIVELQYTTGKVPVDAAVQTPALETSSLPRTPTTRKPSGNTATSRSRLIQSGSPRPSRPRGASIRSIGNTKTNSPASGKQEESYQERHYQLYVKKLEATRQNRITKRLAVYKNESFETAEAKVKEEESLLLDNVRQSLKDGMTPRLTPGPVNSPASGRLAAVDPARSARQPLAKEDLGGAVVPTSKRITQLQAEDLVLRSRDPNQPSGSTGPNSLDKSLWDRRQKQHPKAPPRLRSKQPESTTVNNEPTRDAPRSPNRTSETQAHRKNSWDGMASSSDDPGPSSDPSQADRHPLVQTPREDPDGNPPRKARRPALRINTTNLSLDAPDAFSTPNPHPSSRSPSELAPADMSTQDPATTTKLESEPRDEGNAIEQTGFVVVDENRRKALEAEGVDFTEYPSDHRPSVPSSLSLLLSCESPPEMDGS